MSDARSEVWERVGLAVDVSQKTLRRVWREAAILVLLLVGVLVVYGHREQLFGIGSNSPWETPIQGATVLALLVRAPRAPRAPRAAAGVAAASATLTSLVSPRVI